MQLETERLILRELNTNDFDALYEILGDSDIMQHYPYTFDEKRVRNWITKNIGGRVTQKKLQENAVTGFLKTLHSIRFIHI